MSESLQFLIIEDSKVDADLVLEELASGGFNAAFERVETPESMQEAISRQDWDLIISDYYMPRFSALAAYQILQESGRKIPFIIVSGSIGEELAVQALHLGIDDYLMKDNLARLVSAVERELNEARQYRALQKAEEALKGAEQDYHLLIDAVKDYGIFMLNAEGLFVTWNAGAERILGYTAAEILGKPFACLFTPDKVEKGEPQSQLEQARIQGRFEAEEVLVRQDGSTFWANNVVTPVYNLQGQFIGFSKVLQDITARRQAETEIQDLTAALEQRVIERTEQLMAVNKELESFTYSVSHDLRSPLRRLSKLSLALKRRCADQLDTKSQEFLDHISIESQQATELINDLLTLSKVSQHELKQKEVNLSVLAEDILQEFQREEPGRSVTCQIMDNMLVKGDPTLLKIALKNLLDNAWKFTSKCSQPVIEVGAESSANGTVFFVHDNGAGFDPAYADKLFTAFQRLHGPEEFPGTGVGLSTVQRIIHRHGGRIWAQGAIEQGTTVYFVLK